MHFDEIDVVLQWIKIVFSLQFVIIFKLLDRFLKYFGMLLNVFREFSTHLEVDLSRFIFGDVWDHIVLIFQVGKHVGFVVKLHSKVTIFQFVTKAILFYKDPLRYKSQFQKDITLINFFNFDLFYVLLLLVEFVHVQLKFLHWWSLTFILVTFDEFFINLNKFCIIKGPIVNSDWKTLRDNIFGGEEGVFLDFLKSWSIFSIYL